VVSDRFELTAWSGHRVIAKTQRPWGGCLDGMNEDGLVASITDGGSRAQGLGFSVILLLRYVLETCSSVDQAIAALSRIPIALSQNVTLLDRTGQFTTVFLGPDREPAVSRIPACTNHQEVTTKFNSELLTSSLERKRTILAALEDHTMTLERLTAKFFEPPLYSSRKGSQRSIPPFICLPKGVLTIFGRACAGASASITSWLRNTLMITGSCYPDHRTCLLLWHFTLF
jgi:predicted choloylglycine hydrolase